MEDDPLLFKVMVDQLEWRDADEGDLWTWDADAWLGKDLNKLWFKTEGERIDSTTESGFAEVLYSRAIATYWGFQAGWRHDFEPEPDRDWFAAGYKGLSPYFFETDATRYAGGNGAIAGRIEAEYEILFTQRLILTPEVELDFYSKDDTARGIGSGFSNLELGLRLRYEFRRQFAVHRYKLGETTWQYGGPGQRGRGGYQRTAGSARNPCLVLKIQMEIEATQPCQNSSIQVFSPECPKCEARIWVPLFRRLPPYS